MAKKTPVYDYHQKHGRITEYAGFDLPVWYEGIIPECKAVRNSVGLFDVSHMGRIDVEGKGAQSFLDRLTTNDVSALPIGQGHYNLFCNPGGGIIDDLTIFRLASERFLVVYNAANRDKNWKWMRENLAHDSVILSDISDQSAMFAVQGPKAQAVLKSVSGLRLEEIDKYASRQAKFGNISCLITRSGYTGEDGFEVYVWKTTVQHPENAVQVWDKLLATGRENGIQPAGLGARDVLRLEAGMCLYGNDIDEETSPVEARLSFVLRLDKKSDFIGRDAIQQQKAQGPTRVRFGFRTLEKGIPRHGIPLLLYDQPVGKVTSGTFSPTLGFGIGMGYTGTGLAKQGETLQVKIRERNVSVEVVRMPFYQRRSQDNVMVLGEEMGLKDFRKKYAMAQHGA